MELKIQDPIGVSITSVKLSMKCQTCGHTWGITLDDLLQIPYRGDRCVSCWKKRINAVTKSFEGKEGAE